MPRILVVDDSRIDLARAAMLLEKHIPEAELETARDGAAALEMIGQSPPSVVVTDLQMPDVNGLELVVSLQKSHPLVPIVLMTAAGSEQIAAQALQAGAASYVPKKLLATDLVPTVTHILGALHEQQNQRRLLHSLRHARFELANNRSLLADFAHEFRLWAQEQRLFSESDCFRVTMAIDEALANAYYHGNLEVSSDLREEDTSAFEELAKQRLTVQPYADRRIWVDIGIEDGFVISIEDEGPGFDVQHLPDPYDPGFVERASGRGVVLMRSFMDAVTFNDRGNRVTMTKQICHPVLEPES